MPKSFEVVGITSEEVKPLSLEVVRNFQLLQVTMSLKVVRYTAQEVNELHCDANYFK